MLLRPGFIDELRNDVKLSQVASRWVTWDTRKSNSAKGDFWAPCPFHDEISASFHVDDRKGFYYCFECHAKGDVLTILREKDDLGFLDAVRRLAFIAGRTEEFDLRTGADQTGLTLLQLKDIIVSKFDAEHLLEIGVLTGRGDYVRTHDRLLRSQRFGDPDYPGHVLQFLMLLDTNVDGAIEMVRGYIISKFGDAASEVISVGAFSSTRKSLDYVFEASRDDVVGVMMPINATFAPVYEAIKTACGSTHLRSRRADEMWDQSVLMKDILSLINHSKVVICDLSSRNPNVFYELGIAHAWGKLVIPIAQSADDVPFDLRHHRYITYLNNAEGLASLQEKIKSRLVSLLAN